MQGQSDYYVATRINPYDTQYLDIVLEGVADGWAAIGFSQDCLMVRNIYIYMYLGGEEERLIWN